MTEINWSDLAIVFSVFVQHASLLDCAAITPLILQASSKPRLLCSLCRQTYLSLLLSFTLFLAGGQPASSHTPSKLGAWVSRVVMIQRSLCLCLALMRQHLSACVSSRDVWESRAWKMKSLLPLALTTLGMNSLVTLNSFGVYGNIIRSPVDIPQPL